MSYTFDKAINDLENLDPEDRLTKYEVRAIIELLREEYAPTVEMTELQREYWEKANENNFKALDKKTTSGLFVADMPDKKNNTNINS